MMANLNTLEHLRAFLVHHLSAVHHVRLINVAYALGASYALLKVIQVIRRRLKTTALRGPSSPSLLWGVSKVIFLSTDSGEVYEKWAEGYGGAYEIPWVLGNTRIVLCDPKAIAHLYGGEPWTYVQTPFSKIGTEGIVGKGSLLTARGEDHRRQRKTLTPAFNNAAIGNLISVFYESAYKAKGGWDSLIEEHDDGDAVIEVQNWMNHISLETIGIAGFSHHFGSLDGKKTLVEEAFNSIGSTNQTVDLFFVMLAQVFPWLLRLPIARSKHWQRLNDTMGEISNAFLTKSRKEKEAGTLSESEEKSILGLLIKAEDQGGQRHLTREEVTAQAKTLLLAGYESTSISLTWALIELSKNPDIQTKLRAELLEFGADPTYDQLLNGLPYLDAVVHETLRMHAPFSGFTRMAAVDDVIPLSKPVRTQSGKFVDHISVTKGTYLSVSVPSINRSTALWGPDAKEFNPERWIREDGIPAAAKEIQGHRHLLTFLDGPRTCLGKGFAVTEFKIVLSVLVKHFMFELRDGPETVIEIVNGILPRPKVAGEQGTAAPLRVRRFE
ncbi:cytochrome P450 [Boletus edulis BED1]|uniref:Cytochrome P450 n=1 Tax=Boletus edulis BED1 TaxID=1328754 RepID=A0AAD4GBN0_BOLED|nr:cytochrome P450 [Boletus edulis BED1]